MRDEDRRLKVIANDLLFIILLVPESNSGFGGQQELFIFFRLISPFYSLKILKAAPEYIILTPFKSRRLVQTPVQTAVFCVEGKILKQISDNKSSSFSYLLVCVFFQFLSIQILSVFPTNILTV